MGGISGALTVGRALFLGEAAVDVDLRFGSCQRAHIEGRPLKNTLRFPVHFYFPQNRDEPTLYRSYSFVLRFDRYDAPLDSRAETQRGGEVN